LALGSSLIEVPAHGLWLETFPRMYVMNASAQSLHGMRLASCAMAFLWGGAQTFGEKNYRIWDPCPGDRLAHGSNLIEVPAHGLWLETFPRMYTMNATPRGLHGMRLASCAMAFLLVGAQTFSVNIQRIWDPCPGDRLALRSGSIEVPAHGLWLETLPRMYIMNATPRGLHDMSLASCATAFLWVGAQTFSEKINVFGIPVPATNWHSGAAS